MTGKISLDSMGLALIHEHMLVDFTGADSINPNNWNRDSVITKVLPYLLEVKKYGVKTILDCTPSYLGKDPLLLQRLSELSKINILTNTGYYGAVGGKYLPEHAFTETAAQLAARWIAEYENGIEGTAVKPGFIKISVNEGDSLNAIDKKLVQAAAITHKKTGLAIVSHTGTWKTALNEIKVLKEMGVDYSHFVWVHAQAEQNFENYITAANLGVWISLDGIGWDVESHKERLLFAKKNALLHRILISHDAGWYDPAKPGGGDFQPFTNIFVKLIPELNEQGFSNNDWNYIMAENPKRVFGIYELIEK
ncbi:MAG: phosphotriesterase [Flavobacteriaceae bacterium]|nr:phosphotriesterase [Flavobacteriaceae bacterium]